MITRTTTTRLGVLLAAAALVLTGCSTTSTDSTSDAVAANTAGDSVTMTDAWVKSAESGMSAAFGELTNDSDAEITVVSVSGDASSMYELHETLASDEGEMVMSPIEGGFTVAAGETLELAPGGNHLMLMDVTEPLVAGAEATFTLTFSDDSTYEFTAPVKDYSGANETYEGDEMDMDMDEDMDMDMDEDDDHEDHDH